MTKSRILPLIVIAILATVPLAGDDSLGARGKEALRNQNYDAARELFVQGIADAKEKDDLDAYARFIFYQGLADQVEGESSTGDLRQELLASAANSYVSVLKLKPESGSTMVNLAKVLHQQGHSGRADKLFQKAIELNDAKQTVYLASYGDFLLDTGDDQKALAAYERVLRTEPNNLDVKQKIEDYYRNPDADWGVLHRYLWWLATHGRSQDALDLALEALGDRDEKQELLTVAVAALAKKPQDAEAFLESPTAEFLSEFGGDPQIGSGIEELFKTYGIAASYAADSTAPPQRAYAGMSWSWWQQGSPWQEPEVGVFPRDAMRQLMRSIGTYYERRQQPKVAEACYEAAATLTEDQEIDPAAVRDLVNLYAKQEDQERLEGLARRFEFRLFEGKGQAYRSSQKEKIYQYHRTLGQVYSYLAEKTGDWGNSGKVDSAVFQLRRAYEVGQELDLNQDDDPLHHGYHVDPILVHKLATAYEESDDKEEAVEVRLKAAEAYSRAGDQKAASYVLAPVSRDDLAPISRLRYEAVRDANVASPTRPQVDDSRPEAAQTPRTQDNLAAQAPDQTVAQMVLVNPNVAQSLSVERQEFVGKFVDAIRDYKGKDAETYWSRIGAPGKLLNFDLKTGVLLLEVDGEKVEVKVDRD